MFDGIDVGPVLLNGCSTERGNNIAWVYSYDGFVFQIYPTKTNPHAWVGGMNGQYNLFASVQSDTFQSGRLLDGTLVHNE